MLFQLYNEFALFVSGNKKTCFHWTSETLQRTNRGHELWNMIAVFPWESMLQTRAACCLCVHLVFNLDSDAEHIGRCCFVGFVSWRCSGLDFRGHMLHFVSCLVSVWLTTLLLLQHHSSLMSEPRGFSPVRCFFVLSHCFLSVSLRRRGAVKSPAGGSCCGDIPANSSDPSPDWSIERETQRRTDSEYRTRKSQRSLGGVIISRLHASVSCKNLNVWIMFPRRGPTESVLHRLDKELRLKRQFPFVDLERGFIRIFR